MVVAINKCDKYNADVKKSKADLLAHNIHLEEYGGDVQAVCISALQVNFSVFLTFLKGLVIFLF